MKLSNPILPLVTTLGLITSCGLNVQAQITVDVGNIQLQPNTPNQLVTINVSGVSGVAGLDFWLQVSDGFPDVSGSIDDGPNITSVDVVTGTLFQDNNDGNPVSGGLGTQHQYRGVLVNSGTVAGSGLLASIRLDTTGFSSGSWALKVKDVVNGPSLFYDENFDVLPASLTDGLITIVPEPQVYSIVFGLALLGGAVVKRRFL